MPRPRKLSADKPETGGLPDPFKLRLNPSLPKTAQVYDVLRRAIVTLVLPPGAVINEKLMCEQLEISRTPLREAILQLGNENLVSVIPHSGTYVARIDLQTVFDGQLVRDALEMKVVRLAAIKMTPLFERQLDFNLHQQRRLARELDYDGFYELDEDFHSMICDIGASHRIWRIVNGAKAQLDRVRRLAFPVPEHMEIVLREHLDIVAGLKARDPDWAGRAMQVHLDRVFDTIRRLIAEKADYFSTSSSAELDLYEGTFREKPPTRG